MEKKGIIRCVKEILLKHEGNTSEGAIYWDSEWVGGRQIPMGMGGWRQEGGKLVSADKAFYKEMADFISQELDKAREEGKKELIKEIRESVKENIKIDDTEKKHIKIDTDIVKILNDKEITKMFLDGEEGEDIDWGCYGGWGWYS